MRCPVRRVLDARARHPGSAGSDRHCGRTRAGKTPGGAFVARSFQPMAEEDCAGSREQGVERRGKWTMTR